MPTNPTYPGVYVEEIASGVRTLVGVATSVTAFVGTSSIGPLNEPVVINNFGDYERTFGGLESTSKMSYAVRDYYVNGGAQAVIVRVGDDDATAVEADYIGSENDKTGLYALEDADIFNMLCIPNAIDISLALANTAAVYCKKRRAMLILDPPSAWSTKALAVTGVNAVPAQTVKHENAAMYFPRLRQADPLDNNVVKNFAPCGAVAGVIARTLILRSEGGYLPWCGHRASRRCPERRRGLKRQPRSARPGGAFRGQREPN